MGAVLTEQLQRRLRMARLCMQYPAGSELPVSAHECGHDAFMEAWHNTDWEQRAECVGVHCADDRPLYNQILDTEGFDHTTGCDTAFSDHHAGAMICAGFAIMEIDHEY